MIGTILTVLLLAFLAVIYEIVRNSRIRFRTVNLSARDSSEPGELLRARILHLSDIHLTSDSLQRLEPLEQLKGRVWDFVLVTGDLIDDDSGIEPVCRALGALTARYGKFAVLGNHDYMAYRAHNPWQWLKLLMLSFFPVRVENFCRENAVGQLAVALQKSGVRLLRNEMTEGLIENGEWYQIFGIDDPSTDRDNPAPLYPMVRKDALRLVIMHSPRRLAAVKPLRPDLVLCGHTHGGQFCLPWLGALHTHSDARRRECSGLTVLEECRVHISPGMGAGSVLPYRILAPPEITEIVLEKK